MTVTPPSPRFDLAIRAYEHTAAYDGMIANYFGCLTEGGSERYPRTFNLQLEKVQEMRYGEPAPERCVLSTILQRRSGHQ